MHFIPGDIPPLLNKLFNALQSIPPTSVESERAFSITGQFATKLRKKLADNTLNSLFVYLNYVPYARHYNPRFVLFLPHFSFSLRFILQTTYGLKTDILHF